MATLRPSRFISKKYLKNPEKSLGFTLIELVVVMGIIGILSSILIGYSRQSSKNLFLTTTEARLLSIISRTKFLAIETFFQQINQSLDDGKICAYGVHVDYEENEIFIFQDKSETNDCSTSDNIFDESRGDVKLSGELDVAKLDTAILTLGGDLDNIVFIPPDPDVVINGDSGVSSAMIEVGIKNNVTNFIISVNNAGQVSAE